MKKFRLINIWAIVLACVLLAPIPVQAVPTQSRSVIVVFKHSIDHSLIRGLNANVEKSYKNFPIVKMTLPEQAILALAKNPNVKSIESEVIFTINEDTIEWGIAKVEAPKAWAQGYTGAGVKVGIIDTGIAQHDDLVIAGGANFVDTASSYYDDNGHGTHVAGTVAALDNGIGVIGVAPGAQLYAIKVLNSSGSGTLSDIIEGIDFAISEQLDIINMSLGTSTDSPALHTAVDTAYSSGILVVASAGNSGKRVITVDNVGYPAKYDSAIAVAATDVNNLRASFSSTGPAVEVAAPGVYVRSTYLNNSYATMSGTSMAAPHVSGHLALMIQSFLTNVQPPVTKETFTSVVTNKSLYTVGEKILITVTVVDEYDMPVEGANVKITITPPIGKTKVTTANLITDSNGIAVYTYSTNKVSTKGVYTVKAETTLLNYTSSAASVTFILN